MAQLVIHQPRVAWDGARAFVRMAGGRDYEAFAYEAFAGRVHSQLGRELYIELAETRERILTAWVRTGGDQHATDIELGRWRVRLEDLLRTHPDLLDPVLDLIASTR